VLISSKTRSSAEVLAFPLHGKRRLLRCRVRRSIVKVAGDRELSRRDGLNAGLNNWN